MKASPAFSAVAGWYSDGVLARADLTPGTRVVYRSCLRVLQRHWPGLANIRIGTIRPGDCRRWFTRRQAMVGPNRLKTELAILKGVFDYAVEEGFLTENPAASLLTDAIEHHTVEIPTRIELNRLLRRLVARGLVDLRDMVELLACSGMTRAEASGLIWDDVSFTKNIFRVRDARGVCRTVPLFPNMRRLLERIAARRNPLGHGEPVLRFQHGAHGLRTACKKSGLSQVTYRGLRNFFALEALKQNVSYPMIAAWLGHKDGGVQIARLHAEIWETPDDQQCAARLTYEPDPIAM